ncbi:MAG TPA: MBL fold metallo-hydrolase, partial [Deinococcales bacterium]|nr:MBL fold metallo-hydrolase [Deinococcales bacterium]
MAAAMEVRQAGIEAEVRPLTLHLPGSEGGEASEAVNAYLARGEGGAVLVDCGPGSTVDQLLAALGDATSEVRALLLTHIHLDHGGAAGELSRRYSWPVFVHARGAPHLTRPERLLRSARSIYGEAFDRLWGAFEPVPAENLRPLQGGETLQLAGLAFGTLATPGHAVHHLAYTLGREVFCGDVAGIRVPDVQAVIAPTPPPDINVEQWLESLDLIAAYQPARLHLAHVGSFEDVSWHLDALRAALNAAAEAVRDGLRAGEDRDAMAARLEALL